jgi:hypothetical protein
VKEIVTTSANFYAVRVGKKLAPEIEIGLVLSEPHYRPDHGGEMIKERRCETVRFAATPDTLRRMAEGLIKFANEADEEIGGLIQAGKEDGQ